MKKYKKPKIDIEIFVTEDILTDSAQLRESTYNAGSVSFTTLQTLQG